MQRKQFIRLLGGGAVAVAAAPLFLTACGGDDDDAGEPLTPPATTTLSAAEIAGLKFMREEEKLAYDVYVALYAAFQTDADAQVFYNISFSEATHTEAIRQLLVKYGIDDPAAGNGRGEFTDPALQALYDTLIAQGMPNIKAALSVGALIEETDIVDIRAKLADVNAAHTDIISVYESLMCGSRNHLRSFDAALTKKGVDYIAQVLTQEEYDAIASSPEETCKI